MPVIDNKGTTHKVRQEISRRCIDSSLLSVLVVGGTVHLTGTISKLKTHPDIDLRKEQEQITHLLHLHCGVKDVVWEAVIK